MWEESFLAALSFFRKQQLLLIINTERLHNEIHFGTWNCSVISYIYMMLVGCAAFFLDFFPGNNSITNTILFPSFFPTIDNVMMACVSCVFMEKGANTNYGYPYHTRYGIHHTYGQKL